MGSNHHGRDARHCTSWPPHEATALDQPIQIGRNDPSGEDRLQALIEASPDVVYRMSADWQRIDQLFGHGFVANVPTPCTNWLETYFHPEDRPSVQDAVEKAIRNKLPFDLESRVYRADGSLGWAHSRAVPLMSDEGEILEWIGSASDITARKEAQEMLRLATEVAHVGIWIWDFANDRVTWSDRCKSLLFMPSSGQPSLDYFWSIVHPDDLARVKSQIMAARESRLRYETECRLIAPDGRAAWIKCLGGAYPLGDPRPRGMGGIILDITEHKTSENELDQYRHHLEKIVSLRTAELVAAELEKRQLATRLQVAANAAQLGVWSCNFTDNTLAWDARMQSLYEAPPAMASGQSLLELWHSRLHSDDWVAAEKAKIEMRQTDQPFEYTFRIVLPGNRIRHIKSTSLTQFDASGTAIGAVGTNEDITERVMAEQELLASKRQADAANLSKTKFLAAASHDLRQPLAATSLVLNALRASSLDENQSELVDLLQKANDAQKQMLNSLLDLARLDAGAVRPEVAAVEVQQLFVWIEDAFWMECKNKGLRFNIYHPQEKLALLTDDALLKAILSNLVGNALKYCHQGGILVSLRKRRNKALIQVWDTGIGIAPEHRKLVFDEFYQVGNSERDSAKGLGLGLSIVKRLAKLIGAQIFIRSRLGRGSVFEIRVPLVKQEKPDLERHGNGTVSQDTGPLLRQLANRGITVIEDNLAVRQALVIALDAMGMKVTSFDGAESALASPGIAESEMYISDFRLPGPMNGLELLAEIERRKRSPINAVVLTGDTLFQQHPELTTCQWPVLIKPCDIREVLTILANPKARPIRP